jgi:uncharacterized membrane protein
LAAATNYNSMVRPGITYHDEQNSLWVTEVVGRHEWDAVNENWLANRQIGWRSRKGLENAGRVTLQPQGPNQTLVTVYITYTLQVGRWATWGR